VARISQQNTVGVASNTFSEYLLLEGGGMGPLPFATQVHRGALTLAATTGTDTADFRLTFPLSENVAWKLSSFNVSILAQNTDNDWEEGNFELHYSPSTIEFGGPITLYYGLAVSSPIDSGVGGVQSIGMGIRTSAATTMEPILGNRPDSLVSTHDVAGSNNPALTLTTLTNAAISTAVFRFALVWKAYTYEQIKKAILWL